jgi:hypothetical protein
MKTSVIDTSELQAFLRSVEAFHDNTKPRLEASGMFMLLLLDARPDIHLALQVGMALLMDKPLFIIATRGLWIPPRLRNLAEAVVEGDSFDAAMRTELQAAIMTYLKKAGIRQ